MRSRSIGMLLAALIMAFTVSMIIIIFWSLQNRVPPASAAAKPMVQGAPSSRLPVAGDAAPARVLGQGGKNLALGSITRWLVAPWLSNRADAKR
jgi:hypothetical protein